jgi:hypothetical protein
MKELVEFEFADGGRVIAEIDDHEPGVERASRVADEVRKATASLEQSFGQVQEFTVTALDRLRGLAERPDSLELGFGIRLNARAGAVLASTEAEGHLQVKLTWSKLSGQ